MSAATNGCVNLLLLRHGQAEHNCQVKPIFDPQLTVKGFEQVSETSKFQVPSPEGVFWVSPLRRTLQTAYTYCPEVREWVCIEDLREVAGVKIEDGRHRKSELVEMLKNEAPSVNFNWTEIVEEDPYKNIDRREDAGDLVIRLVRVVDRILRCGAEDIVIVSHSGLLSCFMSFINQNDAKAGSRWLANAEIRIIKLLKDSLMAIKVQMETVLEKKFSTHPENILHAPLYQCNSPLKVVTEVNGAVVMSIENFLTLFTSCSVKSSDLNNEPVIVVAYPLVGMTTDEQVVVCNQAKVLLKSDKTREILNGVDAITYVPSSNSIHVKQMGVYCRSNVLLLCIPRATEGVRINEKAPFWCTAAYIQILAEFIEKFQRAVLPLSLNIILPFTV